MNLSIEPLGDVTVVIVHAEHLDASVADEFKQDMASVIDEHLHLVIDMRELWFVDSAGIGSILTCLRRERDKGGDVKLCNLAKTVRASFEIARMHRIVDIYETREEAINAFK